jgi:hypothetical protein
MEERARAHHYLFAHRMMPTIFFQDPEKFIGTLNEHGMPFLRFLWDRAGQVLEPALMLPGDGLDYQTRGLEDGTRIVAISLPAPQAITEAYFVALVYRPVMLQHEAIARCFTLEYGRSVFNDQPRTVLCEWSGSSHLNYGDGPEPTAEAFIASISDKLVGKE